MKRRTLLSNAGLTAIGALAASALPRTARAQWPGVTKTEIKIGNTIPYSGPASAYGVLGRCHTAFWKMVNEDGGIAGRQINFISLDDGYVPSKTVEQVRRLVEQDQIAFLFAPLGTATNTAIEKYMNQRKVPQLFVATGADKWGDYKEYPWTIGWQPSYRVEAQIYAKHILATAPNGKIAVLYQNDDFGKDYLAGLRDIFGADYDRRVVKQASYEVSDPTVDSQVVSLQGSGADVLVTAATPKFAAQTIRKVFDVNWHPLHLMTNVSASIAGTLEPAGLDKSVGVITSLYLKDQTDPAWANDPGMNQWRAFMKRMIPDGELNDGSYAAAYGADITMLNVLKQCGDDFSRENVMKQVTSIHDMEIPTLLPGIRLNTSPTNYHPVRQLQLARFTGKTWARFGDVIEGAGA